MKILMVLLSLFYISSAHADWEYFKGTGDFVSKGEQCLVKANLSTNELYFLTRWASLSSDKLDLSQGKNPPENLKNNFYEKMEGRQSSFKTDDFARGLLWHREIGLEYFSTNSLRRVYYSWAGEVNGSYVSEDWVSCTNFSKIDEEEFISLHENLSEIKSALGK